MGGANSGRIAGFAKFDTVEDLSEHRLRARVLPALERDMLSDYRGRIDVKGVSRVRLFSDGLMLNISYQIDRGLESRLEHQRVLLTSTVCHLAGERLWFRCPRCDRRAGSIFLVEPPFGCRVCLQLRYESQRENLPGGGILTRASRISDRLGGTGSCFDADPRPKGMHRRTYNRLLRELQKLRRQYFGAGAEYFGLPKIDEPHEEDVGYRKRRAKRDKGAGGE